MDETLRYLTLSGIIALGSASLAAAQERIPMQGVNLTGVELRVNDGEKQVQFVQSDTAVLNEDDGEIHLDNLLLNLDETDGKQLKASAPEGVIVVAGDRPNNDDEEITPPDYEEILSYRSQFSERSRNGDMLLTGQEQSTFAEIVGIATLESATMIWSEKFRQVLIPTPFTQRGTMEDGTILRVEGAALAVDQKFENWTYYAVPGNSGKMTFEQSEEVSAQTKEMDSE